MLDWLYLKALYWVHDHGYISFYSSSLSANVEIALIKGVTIAFRCRAGKIPDNQICFLTSSEPENIQTSPNLP